MADLFRRTGVRGGTMSVAHLVLAGESSTTMAARLGPLAVIAALFLPPFAMARQGVPETDSKSLEKNRSLGLSFAVGCANRALTPRRTRASPSEMAMSVVQAAVAPARLTVPPRARTRALPARTRALPARRARVVPRASADGAAEEVAKEVKEALDGSSLFLVGMMGTGKSSVGKKLAASLGYSSSSTRACPVVGAPRPSSVSDPRYPKTHREPSSAIVRPVRPSVARPRHRIPFRHPSRSDEVIEQVTKTTIPEIFAESGEDGFREIETQVLAEIAAQKVRVGDGRWRRQEEGQLDAPAQRRRALPDRHPDAARRTDHAGRRGDQAAVQGCRLRRRRDQWLRLRR